MNLINKTLSQISCHKYLRCDYKYWQTQKLYAFADFSYLKDMFEIISGSVQTKSYSTEKTHIPYIRIGDISYKFGISNEDMVYLYEDAEISVNRILRKDDLVLATIGATVGKIGLVNEFAGGTHSNNTVILRKKLSTLNIEFYEKLFQSDIYIKYIFGVVSQKAQPNLQLYDLENIKIPNITDDAITNSIIAITPFVEKIKPLLSYIVSHQEIIDAVLKHEFGNIDDLHDKLHKGMSYGTQKAKNTDLNKYKFSFSELGKEDALRVSSRSHNPLFNDFEILLKNFGVKELRQVVTYIDNGASPTYIDSGDIPVIKTANITVNGLSFEDTEFVDEMQHAKSQKAQIENGDILICNIGKGSLGKTTINTVNDKMFAAAETMIVRVDTDKYNPVFLCYFLNSIFGIYQFEREYTGTTNQIHISPKIVERFIVPDISIDVQQRIVDEIQAEINKQNDIKMQIVHLRAKIDEIIENAIFNS